MEKNIKRFVDKFPVFDQQERDTRNIQPLTSVLECSSGFPKVIHRGNLEQVTELLNQTL